MTISVITTPGGITSNSFVSLEEADTYLEAHLQATEWAVFNEEQKKAALISSTREINQLRFSGRKATTSQALSWPRTGIIDYDGFSVTGIPQALKDAVCELSIYRLTEDDRIAGDFELENLKSVEIGPIKYTVNANTSVSIPPIVRTILNSIGPALVSSTRAKVMVL